MRSRLAQKAGARVGADLRRRVRRGLNSAPVINAFHRAFYYAAGLDGLTTHSTSWLGTPVWKNPLDLWVYQEMLVERRPDVIVETGTYRGGSALFFASIFDLLGHGRVVTVDMEDRAPPQHERIAYLLGSSTSDEVAERIRTEVAGAERVMVILDSAHWWDHVLEELRLYAPLVTPGQYLIVEDTNLNGNPVLPEHGPGPGEAVEMFLASNDQFRRDRAREKLLLTFNPGGFLVRNG